jgi:hypothetical protein
MRMVSALLLSLLLVVTTNVSAASVAADARSELLSVFQSWTGAYDKGELDGTMRIFYLGTPH